MNAFLVFLLASDVLATGIKTYVLFGVVGKPSEPKDMYLIPLDDIDYNSYSDRYLEETWFSKYKIEKGGFKIEDFTDA